MASKPAPGLSAITADDESGLTLDGFLVFADEPKAAARDSLGQLAALGIEVKVATGDNPRVAEKVCADLNLPSKGTITGADMEALDGAGFDDAAQNRTIFARISPEQKARLIVSCATQRAIGRLPRRRRQRRVRPACRRRRDLGGHRHRCRQGRRRRGAVGEGSGRAGDRRRRGPAHLRQHHQVRADGDVEQLRQHVQRGRGLGDADVPADAAQPDPAEQPALRQLTAGDPHRQCRRRAAARTVALEHRVHPPVHADVRSGQLFVRLPDVRADARGVARRAGRVPHRVVCGIARHADVDHLRHPHSARAVLPQPAQWRVDTGHLCHNRGGRGAHRVTAGPQSGFYPAAVAILHRAGLTRRSATWYSSRSPRRCSTPIRCAWPDSRIAPAGTPTAFNAEPPGSPLRRARPPAGRARPVTNVGQGRCCGCHLRRIQSAHRYRRATGASPIAHRWTAQESEFSNTLAPVSAHRYCARIGKLSRYRTAGDHQTRDAVQPVSSGVAGSLRLCLRAVAAGRIAGCPRAGSRRPRRGCRCARWR